VIEFDRKRESFHPLSQNVTEEIIGQGDYVVRYFNPAFSENNQNFPKTHAMVISTQHLIPVTQLSPPAPSGTPQQPIPLNGVPGLFIPSIYLQSYHFPSPESSSSKADADPQDMDIDVKNPDPSGTNPVSEPPIEISDVVDESKAPSQRQQPSLTPQTQSGPPVATLPGGFSIDICFEASKLPMDVAIFNSARAAGGDEKIRKYLQAVLVIGGTALIPGMAHALESR
jgi:actin-related protein 8